MFFERVTELCQRKGISLSTAAREIGLSNSAITYWKRGAVPKASTVQKLADYFDVTVDYLLGNTESSLVFRPSANILPLPKMKEWKVLGGTACGEPIYKELDDETILAPADIDADFVFRCIGDSMINARIFDGDIVFVKRCDVENGQIAVVRVGEEYTLKRIYRGEDYLELRAENPMYPAKIIRGDQEWGEVIGKAVHFLSRVL